MQTKIVLSTIIFLTILKHNDARKHRRKNEIAIINQAEANVRIRCQSVLMDSRDKFLGPSQQMRYNFYDIDRGNRHHWCDAYGLFEFYETFDVFGNGAPMNRNQTWYLKQDGLYLEGQRNKAQAWFWNYPPFESYTID